MTAQEADQLKQMRSELENVNFENMSLKLKVKVYLDMIEHLKNFHKDLNQSFVPRTEHARVEDHWRWCSEIITSMTKKKDIKKAREFAKKYKHLLYVETK